MQAERARVTRLRRLERVRAIARQAAALEAAEAEGAYARLATLAERTGRMAAALNPGAALARGQDLVMHLRFSAGLQELGASTSGDAANARGKADLKQAELAAAERRRAAAAERTELAKRDLALCQADPPLGARRPVGTGLE